MGHVQSIGNEVLQPAAEPFVRARRVLVSLTSLICGAVLPGAVTSTPALSRQKKSPVLGGDFELLDTDGRVFKLSSLRGKIVQIYLGYTGYLAILELTGSEWKLRKVAKAYGRYFDYVGRTTGSTTYTADHSSICMS